MELLILGRATSYRTDHTKKNNVLQKQDIKGQKEMRILVKENSRKNGLLRIIYIPVLLLEIEEGRLSRYRDELELQDRMRLTTGLELVYFVRHR
jgi:hypothetical protein